jgi:hypothetical protein
MFCKDVLSPENFSFILKFSGEAEYVKGNSVNKCDCFKGQFLLWVVIVIIRPGGEKT